MATIVYITGFEEGTIGADGEIYDDVNFGGNGSSFSASSVHARHGLYAARAVAATSATAACYIGQLTKIGAVGIVVGRFAVKMIAPPENWVAYFEVGIPSLYFTFYVYATGEVSAQGSGGTEVFGGASLVEGVYSLIEFRYNATANPHTLEWRVDGVEQSPASAAAAAETTTQREIYWEANGDGNQHGADFAFDDAAFSVTSGDYPLGDDAVPSTTPRRTRRPGSVR